MNEVRNYTMTVKDNVNGKEIVKTFVALREYVKDNVERIFRNKKFREEICRTFVFCIGADITVTDGEQNIVGHGKFSHNAFSGRADYTFAMIN